MGLYKAKKPMFLKELLSPASMIESTANPFKGKIIIWQRTTCSFEKGENHGKDSLRRR
jgi:hypothetical protein